eukprot:scaffold18639_cov57-Phaeocystis_antarctica.AAC.2
MATQGHGEHPAAASRSRSLGKKYRTTKCGTQDLPFYVGPRRYISQQGHKLLPSRRHHIIVIISPRVQHLYCIQYLEVFLALLARVIATDIVARHVRLHFSPPRVLLAHKWRRRRSRDAHGRLLGRGEHAQAH